MKAADFEPLERPSMRPRRQRVGTTTSASAMVEAAGVQSEGNPAYKCLSPLAEALVEPAALREEIVCGHLTTPRCSLKPACTVPFS
jgi:hypothetical protein